MIDFSQSPFITRAVARPRRRHNAVRNPRRRWLAMEALERRFALAAIPTVTVNLPGFSALLGQEIPVTVTFDNTATDPADIGYSPFVNIAMPATGPLVEVPFNGAPFDGISFKPNSASYNGLPLAATTLTFDDQGQATHPFAKKPDGAPVVVTGKPGDQLVVIQLPFGSYSPDQPAAEIKFTGVVSPLANDGIYYPVTATGGFQFQADVAGNPTVDVATLGMTQAVASNGTLLLPSAQPDAQPNDTVYVSLDDLDRETLWSNYTVTVGSVSYVFNSTMPELRYSFREGVDFWGDPRWEPYEVEGRYLAIADYGSYQTVVWPDIDQRAEVIFSYRVFYEGGDGRWIGGVASSWNYTFDPGRVLNNHSYPLYAEGSGAVASAEYSGLNFLYHRNRDALVNMAWSPSYTTFGDSGAGLEVLRSLTNTIMLTGADSDLVVTTSVSNPTPYVGDTLTHTITVDNAGPSVAQSVFATTVIPAGLTYVPGSASGGGSYNGSTRTVTWSLGNLSVGNVTRTVQTTVDQPSSGPIGPLEISATAASSTTDPNPDNNTDTSTVLPRAADLAATMTVDKSAPSIGETVTFEIVVANYGSVTATSVVVNHLVPVGLQFESARATQGGYDSGTGVWAVGSVAGGATQTLTVAAKVVRTARGTVTSTVAVSGREYDPVLSNNAASVDIRVQTSGVIVGTDIGCISGPLVRVIDPDTGADRIVPFFAYETSFRGGVRVYGADVTGDGVPEILTAPGPGRPGEVRVFTTTGIPLPRYNFFPFGPGETGGIEIAAGSITGAGKIQIVAGQSRGALARVFDVTPGSTRPVASTPIRQVQPFGPRFRGGVTVETADIGRFNGVARISSSPDGIHELVLGSGPGIRATVNVYNGVAVTPALINAFNPMEPRYDRGVSVARLPSSTAGAADKLLVSAGSSGGALVQTFTGLSSTRLAAFAAYAGSRAAVFSAAIADNQIFSVEGQSGQSRSVHKNLSMSGTGAGALPRLASNYSHLRVAILRR